MNQRGARILVIDDNEDDIELLRLAFRRSASRCQLLAASTLPDAEARLRDHDQRPDVALVDWKMPGVDTPELIRSVRRDPALIGLPVIVFSSSDALSDVRSAYLAGATAYLMKPAALEGYTSLVHDLNAFWCRGVLYP